MPRDSEPFGPAKLTNCHRFTNLVPDRLPVLAKRIAHRVIVAAQRAVFAALADGEPRRADIAVHYTGRIRAILRSMASVPFTPPVGFDELSIEEKLDYLQALWARVLSQPNQMPVPDWHRQILADRLATYRAGQGSSRPWSEFREELRSLLSAPKR